MMTHLLKLTSFAGIAALGAACTVAGTDSTDRESSLELAPAGAFAEDDDVDCDNLQVGAVEVDTVIVPDGAECLLDGTELEGSIKVGEGAILTAYDVRVNGDIQADGAMVVTVAGASTVGGSVQLKEGGSASISGAEITGDLQFEDNGGALEAFSNVINGNLQAFENSGGVSLSGNSIDGNLQCKENRPAPTGSGNSAASKEDQCAGL